MSKVGPGRAFHQIFLIIVREVCHAGCVLSADVDAIMADIITGLESWWVTYDTKPQVEPSILSFVSDGMTGAFVQRTAGV